MKFALPLLLLLCTVGVNAFTYTCNEVKKIIRDNSVVNGKKVCAAFDANIPTDSGFATKVYLADANGKIRYSLAQVATTIADGGCVSSTDNVWTIVVTDGSQGNNIDCSYEFTLLFSSIDTYLITAQSMAKFYSAYNAYNFTVVAPSGGLLVDFSCKDTHEPLHFYTGLGNGADEQMYYYGNSQCDERLSIFAWDTAITINTPYSGDIMMTYWATGPYLSIGSVSYDVLLLGSGKSSNIIQHGKQDKFMKLTPVISEDLKFQIDGFAEMDQTLSNSLSFSTQCTENHCVGTTVPITDKDINLSLGGDILTVNYNTKVGDDQWRDDDLFFIRISSTPLTSTDAPPTTPPPKPSTDFSCGCDLINGNADFASNIWLDIVFVIDTSRSMGQKRLNTINAMIDSMVSSFTLEDPNSSNKQYTRVALITVANVAKVISNFSTPFPSPVNLQQDQEYYSSYISSDGMSAALDLLGKSSRRSARQLIYIIAAVDSSTFINGGVQYFKDNGGIIAATDADPVNYNLNELATPGYLNVVFDGHNDLQMLCDANCYCPGGFYPYSTDDEMRNTADRGCFQTTYKTAAYELAKDQCEEIGSIVSTVHDDGMENHLNAFLSEQVGPKKPHWIGYEYNGEEWEWIDSSTSPYTKWGSDEPNLKTGRCAYSQQTTGFNTAWFAGDCSSDKYFICELAPCSISKYCD